MNAPLPKKSFSRVGMQRAPSASFRVSSVCPPFLTSAALGDRQLRPRHHVFQAQDKSAEPFVRILGHHVRCLERRRARGGFRRGNRQVSADAWSFKCDGGCDLSRFEEFCEGR